MPFQTPLPPAPARVLPSSPPFSLDLAAGRPPLERAWLAYREASMRPLSDRDQVTLMRRARVQVAELTGCREDRIAWTTGGTGGAAEALYLGLGLSSRRSGEPPARVLVSGLEHAAVSKTLELWQQRGLVEVTTVGANAEGIVRLETLEFVLNDLRPALVSVTAVCGETGVAQPLGKIRHLCTRVGARLHTDAVQAALRIPMENFQADLLTFSGHKLGAIGGVGALCLSENFCERAFWQQGAETSVPAIAALSAVMQDPLAAQPPRVAVLPHEQVLLDAIRPASLIGCDAPRSGNITAIRIHGVSGEAVMMALDARGFAVSNGSACSSGAKQPSRVLMSMGLSPQASQEVIRLSWPEPLPDGPTMRRLSEALREVVSLLRAQD